MTGNLICPQFKLKKTLCLSVNMTLHQFLKWNIYHNFNDANLMILTRKSIQKLLKKRQINWKILSYFVMWGLFRKTSHCVVAHSGWLAERSTFVDVKSARPSGGLLTRRVRSPRRRKWVYRVLVCTQGRRNRGARGAIPLLTYYGRPMKPFFHQNSKLLCLGRQIGQINFGAFGVFSAELSAPIFH